MIDVSVVIPARNEKFLTPTVRDLVRQRRANTEIIVVLEGYWPDEIVEEENVHYIHFTTPRGMRGAINAGVEIAKGKYLMKCDAHCAFDEGFDVKLMADLQHDWIAVPRRYSLDEDNWCQKRKKPIDYMFLCYPDDPNDFGGPSLKGKTWREKQNDASLKDILIDDLMSAQGSCWFMHKGYFYQLDLLDEENYGHFSNEFQEIGLKCWLSGGRVIRNKNTWYAHLHKGRKHGRGWPLGKSVLDKGASFTNRWMDGRNWRKQDRDIRWMVHKFWPVPTWPEESVRLVFHRRKGGSGQIRGLQMAQYFKARLNPPEWNYDFDVHIWVKQEPDDITLPGKHYLDVMDEHRRIPWLRAHPECGVIASSQSGYEYLKEKLGRDDVHLIPQHHCNFERVVRERDEIKVVGVVGVDGAIQCDVDELQRILENQGMEFRWLRRFRNPPEIVAFYKGLDMQIIWRKQNRPLKNPLKIINAMSFGIPTVAYPEIGYSEVEGYYWHIYDLGELPSIIKQLRDGFNAQRLINVADDYHIDIIASLYRELL